MRFLRESLLVFGPGLCCLLLLSTGMANAGHVEHKMAARPLGQQSYAKYAEIPGAEAIGSDQCSECHVDASRSFRPTVHAGENVGCESCHGRGSLHVADEKGHGHIHSFRNESSEAANAPCFSCHSEQTELHGWASATHAREGVRCVDCHRVHVMKVASNQRQVQNEACERCHAKKAAEENLPYRHPLREAVMSCSDCHDPHGGSGANNLRESHVNDLCFRCHAEYQGPFTYQHPPVTENCLKCHSPHGSMNAHLLQVSEPMLCLQCHPGHHNGSGVPLLNACTSCHGSIHGTDTPSATGGSVFSDQSSTARATTVTALPMRSSAAMMDSSSILTGLPIAEAFTLAGAGPTRLDSSAATPTPPASTEYWFQFLPRYRSISTSGYGGRVGEYNSLRSSFGADLALHVGNSSSKFVLNARGSILSRDEYDAHGDLRLGGIFALKVDARSLSHHLDQTPFGVNLSPDDILRDELIPAGSLFGVSKSSLSASARLSIPKTPLTVFVRGGTQSRQGVSELRFYDMGGDLSCGSCHSVSRFQSVKYETQDIAGGLELKAWKATLTYEHAGRVSRNRVGNPVDYFGSTLSSPADELPAGVPDTPAGLLVHQVVPGHRTDSDSLRLNLPLPEGLTLTGAVINGRTRNSYTGNHQKFTNGDATLSWQASEKLQFALDYHQQNTLNDFTPFFSLYGNPSFRRLWAGATVDYRLTSIIGVEAYYRSSRVTRSNADLWPQFYSPDNMDLRRVIPRTTANTLGAVLSLHRGSIWKVRAGYEWVGTHEPGYLTDPGTAHRILVSGSFSPVSWLSVGEDATVVLHSAYAGIDRRNRLYTSMSTLTLTPMSGWSLAMVYAYLKQDLKTDLVFGTDPFYYEKLVPFDATTQAVMASSSLDLLKQLRWDINLRKNVSNSEFRPAPGAAPDESNYFPVAWAAGFSRVDVPQLLATTTLEYRWMTGLQIGVRGEYASYKNRVHPEQTGYLHSLGLFVSKSW
jgi:DmsE family decaheme c-type cytochrome